MKALKQSTARGTTFPFEIMFPFKVSDGLKAGPISTVVIPYRSYANLPATTSTPLRILAFLPHC